MSSDIPHPRSGHRLLADDGHIYSIGGFNPHFWEVDNTEETIYPLFKEVTAVTWAQWSAHWIVQTIGASL